MCGASGRFCCEVDVQVQGKQPINLRLVPNVKAGVIGTAKPSQKVTAVERLADNSWLRVKVADSDLTGWVKTDLVAGKGDFSTLNVVDGTQPNYGPMQAFTFKTGSKTQNCAEVPQDGLIIQTPEGSGEVQLWINQVVVKLGSTIYFEAQSGGDMIVTTIEGHATVTAMGVTQTAVAGTQLHIKMDNDLRPIAAPTVPEAYTIDDVQHLPIGLLQRKITIHDPLTKQEILAARQAQCPTCTGNNGKNDQNCAGKSCNQGNGNNADCPGNSCHDQCPGNSCNAGSNGNNGSGNANNGNGSGNANNGSGNGKP